MELVFFAVLLIKRTGTWKQNINFYNAPVHLGRMECYTLCTIQNLLIITE